MAAIRSRSAPPSRGAVTSRTASPPQAGQEITGVAPPMGRMTSTGPSSVQRYAYRGIGAPFVAAREPKNVDGNYCLGKLSVARSPCHLFRTSVPPVGLEPTLDGF
jgi:hypothetical protein